jgi:hypothetical protein
VLGFMILKTSCHGNKISAAFKANKTASHDHLSVGATHWKTI